jgi:hypothetical protein
MNVMLVIDEGFIIPRASHLPPTDVWDSVAQPECGIEINEQREGSVRAEE